MSKANKEKLQHQEDGLENVEHALTSTEAFIEKYQKQITTGVLAIIVLVGAVMAYNRFYMEPLEQEAQAQMFVGEQYFAQDSFQLALTGDGSFIGFEAVIDDYSSTKAGNLANYYAGVANMHLGKYDEAVDYLSSFSASDILVAPVAKGAIADCYMELDQVDKAISAYKKAASYENTFTTSIYLKKLGLAYEINNDYAKAIDTYSKIKDGYPTTAEARDIDKYIARAESKK